MWCWGESIGWGSWFGGLWMFALGGGLIAFIVWAIVKINRRGSATIKQTSLSIVEERYAKGEISKEEFEQIKKDLS